VPPSAARRGSSVFTRVGPSPSSAHLHLLHPRVAVRPARAPGARVSFRSRPSPSSREHERPSAPPVHVFRPRPSPGLLPPTAVSACARGLLRVRLCARSSARRPPGFLLSTRTRASSARGDLDLCCNRLRPLSPAASSSASVETISDCFQSRW
jgi:hypothetical protein